MTGDKELDRDHLFNNIMRSIAMFYVLFDFTDEEKRLIYRLMNFKE